MPLCMPAIAFNTDVALNASLIQILILAKRTEKIYNNYADHDGSCYRPLFLLGIYKQKDSHLHFLVLVSHPYIDSLHYRISPCVPDLRRLMHS